MEGSERPTATELAERSGVSTSSFFRYFDGIDDLRGQLIARFMEQHNDLLAPDVPPDAPFDERLRLFVEVRVRAGTALGPMARRLQGRAVDEPGLIPMQNRARSMLADQVPNHFGPELATLTPARRADLTAVIDAMTSIDAYRTLDEIHGRSEAQIRRAWTTALTTLL